MNDPHPRLWGVLIPAVLSLVMLGFGEAAHGCLWFYGTDVHGHRKRLPDEKQYSPADYLDELIPEPVAREKLLEKKKQLEELISQGGGFDVQSDLAAMLLYLGEAERAVEILEPLAAQHAEEYALAANLGTAYELAGQPEKALEWIKEGIRRNPEAREGTEWLHVKILEAQIKLRDEPDWLEANSVLGMDFGRRLEPARPQEELYQARKALEYQLHERLAFVQPPNAIVGDLLFDLANIIALETTVEFAVPVLELAVEYEAPRRDLAISRIDHFEGYWNYDSSGRIPWRFIRTAIVAYGVPLVLAIVLFRQWRAYRRRRVARGDAAAAEAASSKII